MDFNKHHTEHVQLLTFAEPKLKDLCFKD